MNSIVISAFSLLVAFAAFIVAYLAYRRDRGDLRVTLTYHPETELGTSFQVRTVNHGRRTVEVETVSLLLESGKSITYSEICESTTLPRLLPKTLEENDYEEFSFPLYAFEDHIHSPLEVIQAEVHDTLGRTYKVRSSHRLKRQISEH